MADAPEYYRWFAPDDEPGIPNLAVGMTHDKLVIRLWDGDISLARFLPPNEIRRLMETLTELTTHERDAYP